MKAGFIDLRSDDVRALLRLSGEVRELGGDPTAWRRHLLVELGRLCGGSLGIAFEHWMPRGISIEQAGREWGAFSYTDTPPQPTEQAVFNAHAVDVGFATERDRAHYYEHVYEGERLGDPAFASLAAQMQDADGALTDVTETSRGLVDRRTWARSPFVQESMRGCGMGEYVLSLQFLRPSQGVVGLYVARPWGEKPFSPRELALVELVHAEIARSLRQSQEATLETLAPRYRRALALLLAGKREKEVADELGLTPATLHQYVKAIYRHFGVSSRAELSANRLFAERAAGPRLKGVPATFSR
jgi:DNA-binding CsgD family transcriptional regulator